MKRIIITNLAACLLFCGTHIFFNDNKEKKNVSVSYKASFCGSPPPSQTKLLSNQLKNKGY
jgi:hypothetical protein